MAKKVLKKELKEMIEDIYKSVAHEGKECRFGVCITSIYIKVTDYTKDIPKLHEFSSYIETLTSGNVNVAKVMEKSPRIVFIANEYEVID